MQERQEGVKFPPRKGEDDVQKPPLDENLPLQIRNFPFGVKTGKILLPETRRISLPETGKTARTKHNLH